MERGKKNWTRKKDNVLFLNLHNIFLSLRKEFWDFPPILWGYSIPLGMSLPSEENVMKVYVDFYFFRMREIKRFSGRCPSDPPKPERSLPRPLNPSAIGMLLFFFMKKDEWFFRGQFLYLKSMNKGSKDGLKSKIFRRRPPALGGGGGGTTASV